MKGCQTRISGASRSSPAQWKESGSIVAASPSFPSFFSGLDSEDVGGRLMFMRGWVGWTAREHPPHCGAWVRQMVIRLLLEDPAHLLPKGRIRTFPRPAAPIQATPTSAPYASRNFVKHATSWDGPSSHRRAPSRSTIQAADTLRAASEMDDQETLTTLTLAGVCVT